MALHCIRLTQRMRTRNPERQQRLAIWFTSVRAPSPQSSPPRGRGSLGGCAIRRGNDHEHSALLTRARPLTSILSPEGERKFERTRNPERQQRLAIWFISVRAPSPQSSPPRGRGSLGGCAIRRGNDHEHSALLTRARPLTSILSPEGERKFGRTRDSERQ